MPWLDYGKGRDGFWIMPLSFDTLAAESGWNSSALFDAFLHGLSPPMKDHLVLLDLPADLDALVTLAVKGPMA